MGIILSIISTHPENLDCVENQEIFISSNGIHLDIVIPRKLLSKKLQEDLEIPKDVSYLSFGWGDKEFYMETPLWRDLKFSTAFKALFLNSETAIHLTHYYKKFDHWNEIRLCKIQLDLLTGYIEQSFERDTGNQLIEIKYSGYTAYDKFYEATGNFNCINTCNNWVNKGLKVAEVKTSIWSPFDHGVLYQIRKKQ